MIEPNKQLAWSQLKVGLVITVSIAILILTVFFAGSIENIVSPRVEITAKIRDVKGLRESAPVWLSGVEIGKVKAISLHPDYGTAVTLSVRKHTLGFLRKDAKVRVLTMGLLGDKYIDLNPGSSPAAPIGPGDLIEGESEIEFTDIMATSAMSIEKLTEFMARLERLVTRIESGGGTISKFIRDPSLYNELKDAARNISLTTQEIRDSRGTLRMLIEDPSLYTRISAATASIEEFGNKLNNGQGTLRKLVEEPELYDNIEKSSVHLSSILDRIDRGEGLLGASTRDQELVTELRALVQEMKELTKDIKENPKKYFKFSLF